MPVSSESFFSLTSLRPTRIGSGMITSFSLILTPPSLMIGRIERMRCWFIPIRPVTPFMMIPIRCVLSPFSVAMISLVSCTGGVAVWFIVDVGEQLDRAFVIVDVGDQLDRLHSACQQVVSFVWLTG